MDKTLNQRIYETPADVKKAIYDSGYEAGKTSVAEQIIINIETQLNEFNGSWADTVRNIEYTLVELKKKYGVN